MAICNRTIQKAGVEGQGKGEMREPPGGSGEGEFVG